MALPHASFFNAKKIRDLDRIANRKETLELKMVTGVDSGTSSEGVVNYRDAHEGVGSIGTLQPVLVTESGEGFAI